MLLRLGLPKRDAPAVIFSVIAAVFLVLSTSLAMGVAGHLHQRSVAAIDGSPPPQYLVLIVLDGAEPSYLHLTSLPHLDALRGQGVEFTRAFAGILESETPAGHAAISTGSSPARDGLLGFNWITDNNDTVHVFDENLVRGGAIEHVMEQAGAPTIASLFKAQYPGTKVVAISGHKYYAADPLGGPKADYILYYAGTPDNRYAPTAIPGHVPPASVLDDKSLIYPTTSLKPGVEDDLVTKLTVHTFDEIHQRVTLLNMPEFDWPLGHVQGGDPSAAALLMRRFDRNLGQIEDAYRKAGVLDRTLFVITADHGMMPLRYQIPDRVLDDAITKAGVASPETTYSSGGYIWLQDPTKAGEVAANVVAEKDPHIQSVYYRVTDSKGPHYVAAGGQTIPASLERANQYLLGSFLGGNAPDVVAFCTEDSAFQKTGGGENWKANHGGGSWEAQHMPLVIAGDGAASGVVSNNPVRIEDIAPTVMTMMGVRPTGMQGTPLADAMLRPTDAQRGQQEQLDGVLGPVVDGLMAQSSHELATVSR